MNRSGYRAQGGRDPTQFIIGESEALQAELATLPEVDEVMLRMAFSGLLNNDHNRWAIIGEGVEPAAEARLGTYINVSEGRQLAEQDNFGMVLGAGVAQALNLRPGNRVNLLANTLDGAVNVLEFEIVGIFQTFSKVGQT